MSKEEEYIARLKEELKFAKAEAYDLRFPEGYREACLRDVRKLETALGIEGDTYNKKKI